MENGVVFHLFKFKKKQQIFEIGGIKVGGQPGELPTVLVGSIFHEGHKIVKDKKLGLFNKKKAKKLINIQDTVKRGFSEKDIQNWIDYIKGRIDYWLDKQVESGVKSPVGPPEIRG